MKVCPECGQGFDAPAWACPHCSLESRIEDGVRVLAPAVSVDRDSYDPSFFAELWELETGHFWFEARNELIVWALNRHFPDAHTYLEIGCGTGFVLASVRAAFPHLRVAGSDLYLQGLAFARERVDGVELVQLDASRIPYESEFDAVGIFDVLEHIDDDGRVLEEINRTLGPGGGVVITVPQHPWLWGVQDEVAHHRRRYTRRELVEKVRRAGFAIERVTSFVSLLLPVMAVSRLRPRSPTRHDALAELRIGRGVNSVLKRVMRAEHSLIRRGVSLPAGGSLLLVARKEAS